MKIVFNIVLVAFSVMLYSCSSDSSKKHDTNSFDQQAFIAELRDSLNGNVAVQDTDEWNRWAVQDTTVNLKKILFPAFVLKIKDFHVECGNGGLNLYDTLAMKMDFDRQKKLTISAKSDTIRLPTFGDLGNMLLELTPHGKKDQFKLFYFYQYRITQKDDGKYVDNISNGIPLNDSVHIFFRFPRFPKDPTNEIKGKLNVTDSIKKMEDGGEFGKVEETYYRADGKLVFIGIQNTCIRIEKYQDGKFVESKILVFQEVTDV